MHPSSARSLHASSRKGCQDFLESYERLGSYGGAEGVVQKGLKTRGGYFKTVRKVKNIQECFQECVDTSKCSSFTYSANTSKCSLSSKEGTTSSASSSSSMVQFCPSRGSVAGIVSKQSTTSSSGGYTAEDVKKHNTRSSAWTVVDGTVYDLTEFINIHPGGSSAILKAAGKDGSSVFNKRGRHSSSDRRTLQAYVIGKLDTSSGAFPVNDPSFAIDATNGDFTDSDDDDDNDDGDEAFTDDERDDSDTDDD